jgi:hypothetical protein
MLKMKWLRKPTIWMCTGLYLFEGTQIYTVSGKSLDVAMGISPATIGALSGVQVGGSVQVNPESSWTLSSTSEERLVWAAQYRKLDLKYIRVGRDETAALPKVLTLYPDMASEGALRRVKKDDMNAVRIDINEGREKDDEAQIEREDTVLEETYYKRLEETIRKFEEEFEGD